MNWTGAGKGEWGTCGWAVGGPRCIHSDSEDPTWHHNDTSTPGV